MSHTPTPPAAVEIPSTSLWAKLPLIGGALGLVGLGATLGAAFAGDRARAMFSYLWAFEVCLSIALGALGWVLVEHTVRAGWSASLRRLGETAMATLPLFALLWVPIGTLGLHSLFPWTHETDAILERKRWFLSEPFFFGRALLYFAIWALLAYLLYTWSVRQDSLAGKPEERNRLTRKMWTISAPGIALYGLTQSFAAIDWLMSLQPHWYSTIFGVYFFAGSILSFYAFLVLVTMGLQRAGLLAGAVTTEHFHDLGKYVFGYTVFWAYIAFSQFMLIWYAGLPEETVFFMVRLEGGWDRVSYALPLLHFAVPFFFLLSRHVKRNRTLLGAAAVWTLVMQMVDLYWLVLPNFGAHGEGAHQAHLALSWTDFAAILGMGGAFIGAFAFLLARKPLVCVEDPRLPEALAHENY